MFKTSNKNIFYKTLNSFCKITFRAEKLVCCLKHLIYNFITVMTLVENEITL